MARRRRLKGERGRGTLAKDKPPILGLIQRGGEVVLHMLANVYQATIQPIIHATVAAGTLIHTDEYNIYARLDAWGYSHKTVCPARGEYVRDEDGDGVCEVHVNTIASPRKSCPPISPSSNSSTTHDAAEKHGSLHSWEPSPHDRRSTTPLHGKSLA